MSALSYNSLALNWQLPGQRDGYFLALSLAAVIAAFLVGMLLSSMPVPDVERRSTAVVPERLARFIAEQPKPVAPPPEIRQPMAVPPPPPPLPDPEPSIRRPERQTETLTEAQRTARERAQSSGLLALQRELSAIADTSALAAEVSRGGTQEGSSAVDVRAGHDMDVIAQQSGERGGISSSDYGSRTVGARLEQREIAGIHSELFVGAHDEIAPSADDVGGSDASGGRRSREEVTIVFDRNKSSLYALYARERRRNPDLEGRIVLRITIAPSGEVTDVQVVSSELNSPSLEAGIVSRIKMFRFKAMDVDEMTVTYPVEFLSS